MIPVAHTPTATGVLHSRPHPSPTPAAAASPLLPAPQVPGVDGITDAMALLYRMIAERDRQNLATGTRDVESHGRAKDAALGREAEGIQKQLDAEREAEEASHGFWAKLAKVAGTVAPIAAVVGSCVFAVATFGAGAPLAVAVVALSVGGSVVQQTNCLGDAVSPWVGAGAQLLASALTLNAPALTGAWRTVSCVVSATGDASEGAAATADAVVVIQVTAAESDAVLARRDAIGARHQAQREDRLIADVLALVKDVHASHERALEALESAVKTNCQTLAGLATMSGRA